MAKENPRDRLHAGKTELARVNAVLKPEGTIRKTAELFGVLSDPTRVKIILALSRAELCVGDLASVVGASDSAVSHQLRILRNLGLVAHRRDGKLALYSLSDEHLEKILKESIEHVSE
ncbi:MAG: transcriptional regulator [Actinobacteria bacterium]|nr:MAG: transcriptional regulator [Actinomycetota bacterium]